MKLRFKTNHKQPYFGPKELVSLSFPDQLPMKALRSWVSLYCTISNGEMGFYKDAKNTASTYNGEPLLSLQNCACEVANAYKKKKNVFKLKTKEGSEFLFHAKDEEELKKWIEAISMAISEHEEIAKWAQSLPTTSSTDEGNTQRAGERRMSVSAKKK
ncbi:SPTN4 protein, partial [Polypterus senegalus]